MKARQIVQEGEMLWMECCTVLPDKRFLLYVSKGELHSGQLQLTRGLPKYMAPSLDTISETWCKVCVTSWEWRAGSATTRPFYWVRVDVLQMLGVITTLWSS